MAHKYASTSFVVPKGYKEDLGIFVKQIASWVSSNFSELTLARYELSNSTYYAYFNLGDTGIQLQIGFYNSGSYSYFLGSCHGSDTWEDGQGVTVSEGSTVSLQLMVVPMVAIFSTLKSSNGEYYSNSSALAVKEIVSGNSYVLSSVPGDTPDVLSKKAIFWFPSRYYYKDASNRTTYACASIFPNNISSLAGVISKEENGGSRAVVISPVIYMKYGPLSLLTAAEDAVKVMYANDGGMPISTNYVPIQVGSDQYVAFEKHSYSSTAGGSSNVAFAYLKVS